jgi:hypothetical protein
MRARPSLETLKTGRSFRYLIGLYATTLVHHVYGGIIYASSERIVLAVVFSVVFAATVWLRRLARASRWAGYAATGIVAVFWIGLIGVYEGGYNHALYVLLSVAEAGPQLTGALYPRPADGVAPDDPFFQATGVLTLVTALLVAFPVPRPRRPARGMAPA